MALCPLDQSPASCCVSCVSHAGPREEKNKPIPEAATLSLERNKAGPPWSLILLSHAQWFLVFIK